MGYRYTFVSEDVHFKFSNEFVEKHKVYINFGGEEKNNLPISSKHELKFISSLIDEIDEEVKKSSSKYGFFMIFIAECGNYILRRRFNKDGVFEMDEKATEG